MYATIRRYTMKATFDKQALEQLRQSMERTLLPAFQSIRGFHSYYLVNAGEKELVSLGVFEDKAGAQESTRRAAEFVKTDPIREHISPPQVIEGELLVSRESPVTA
jgi:hypothetical protein